MSQRGRQRKTAAADRKATPAELAAMHRRGSKINGGPGIVAMAEEVGRSTSWLSRALRGLGPRCLYLSHLRKLKALCDRTGRDW